jgi:hypothetical protein
VRATLCARSAAADDRLGPAAAGYPCRVGDKETDDMVLFAADYPFLDVLWTIIIFFVWLCWIWMVVGIFADIFSRQDISGWAKAGWSVFVIVLPFLGVLIYLIANGESMAERRAGEARASRAEFDDYVKTVATNGGPAGEIEKAKQLLDSGAITQAEFDTLKAKALA